MSDKRLNQSAYCAPAAIALCIALAALVATALIALFQPHPGIPASTAPLGNALGVAGSFLFRHAVRNTALVVSIVGLAVFALARTIQPRVGTLVRTRVWLAALMVTPLFLPVPYATFLMRPLLSSIDMVNRPDAALLAVALVQVWRLWPLALLVRPLLSTLRPGRSAMATALMAAWFALVDVGTPFLSTGGEPFNETHLWATWAFHTLWVSRLWGYGAVMVGGLAVLSGGLAAALWWTLKLNESAGQHAESSKRGVTLVLVIGALVATLPVLWTLPIAWAALQNGTLAELHRAGYWMWALMSFATLAIASLLAFGIAWPAYKGCRRLRSWVTLCCLLIGAATAPIWYGLVWRWEGWLPGTVGLLLAALLGGTSAGLIGIGLLAAHQDRSGTLTTAQYAGGTAALAVLIIGTQFALWIVVSAVGAARTLGAGLVMHLGDGVLAPVAALATVVTFMVTYALVSAAAYALAAGDTIG